MDLKTCSSYSRDCHPPPMEPDINHYRPIRPVHIFEAEREPLTMRLRSRSWNRLSPEYSLRRILPPSQIFQRQVASALPPSENLAGSSKGSSIKISCGSTSIKRQTVSRIAEHYGSLETIYYVHGHFQLFETLVTNLFCTES